MFIPEMWQKKDTQRHRQYRGLCLYCFLRKQCSWAGEGIVKTFIPLTWSAESPPVTLRVSSYSWIHAERQVTMDSDTQNGRGEGSTVLSTDRVVSLENTECGNHPLSSPHKRCSTLQRGHPTVPSGKQSPGSSDSVPSATSPRCTGQQRRDEKAQEVATLARVVPSLHWALSVEMLYTHTVTTAKCFAFALTWFPGAFGRDYFRGCLPSVSAAWQCIALTECQ